MEDASQGKDVLLCSDDCEDSQLSRKVRFTITFDDR